MPIISTDFYPTLLEACGLPLLPEQHKDGVSFLNLLKDPCLDHQRAPLFWHYPHWGNQGGIPSSAIRDGDWKLIRFYYKKAPELYNLTSDPGEHQNLADKNPAKLAELNHKLDAMLKDTHALLPIPNANANKAFDKW